MKRLAFILLFTAIFVSPLAAPAYNDDNKAPAAFVEGTRDYTIKFFEKIRNQLLVLYVNENMLITFDVLLNRLKKENAQLLERFRTLKARGEFLK